MKIMLISYGIIDYDGRLNELVDVAKQLGEVSLVCCGNNKRSTANEKIVSVKNHKYLSINRYLSFLINAIVATYKMKNIDILFVDNYLSSVTAVILKRIFNIKYIVQDVRELYFTEDMPSMKGRLLVKYEAELMRKADVVLAANSYRAEIMEKTHNLNKKPIVFENVRFLKGEYNASELNNKYNSMFKYKINIVSTGGVSVKRGSDKLVKAMKKLSDQYGLYLVGGGSPNDIKMINDIISQNNIENVHLIDKVPLTELKFIVQHCDIGIVNYHQEDLNNKYCASGKVYEYLAEGLPIVTTENIPLKEFCLQTGVGEADNDFYFGIKKVGENIEKYKNRACTFISNISVSKYNKEKSLEIIGLLENADRK